MIIPYIRFMRHSVLNCKQHADRLYVGKQDMCIGSHGYHGSGCKHAGRLYTSIGIEAGHVQCHVVMLIGSQSYHRARG